jgi:nucleotide-binding universal stress UspA family protein
MSLTEKILLPLDGSDLASSLVGQLTSFAKPGKSEIRAVRVLDLFSVDDAKLRSIDACGIAGGQLSQALEPLRKRGFKTSYEVLIGDAARMILAHASEYRPTLIAMATHGRSGIDRWTRGSIAERVLRESPFPVLLANPHVEGGKQDLKKILVPLDGSDPAATILPSVLELAQGSGAEVVLVHALEAQQPAGLPIAGITETAEQAAVVLATFQAQLPGVRVRSLTPKGSSAYAILHAVDTEKPDLVAMTTHGRSGASRWLFGSVAEHVLHQCRAPLLLKRVAGFGAERPAEAGERQPKTAQRSTV